MKQIKRGIVAFLVICVIVTIYSVYSYAHADTLKQKIEMDVIARCDTIGSLVRKIQNKRFDENTEQWDFIYKHGEDPEFAGVEPILLMTAVDMTYSRYASNFHPANAYRDAVVRCERYHKKQESGIKFKL